MMQEVRNGKCKYLVCYKLDRMGRNIIDIASLVEELNKLKVSFISIKENFDTSTPLGKTMLYIAGIFAQMEREQIAERVKDNMLMLAKSGRWLGGNTPLGFLSEKEERIVLDDKVKTAYRLVENPEEMTTVRFIFQEFLEKQSLTKVVEYFQTNGIKTKREKEYTITTVRSILTNPVYCIADGEAYDYFDELGCQMCFSRRDASGKCGIIAYAKTSSVVYKSKENPPEEWILALGKHKGVISGTDYVRVQRLLENNKNKGDAYRKVRNEIALLSGILYCECGHAMRPKYYNVKQVTEEGERKFSYICPYKDATHGEKCSVPNVPGNDLDYMICDELFRYTEPDSPVGNLLKKMREKIDEAGKKPEDEIKLLTDSLAKKEAEIQNLISTVKQAGRSEAYIAYVDTEIVRLEKEKDSLKKKIEVFQSDKGVVDGAINQVDLIISEIELLKKKFGQMSVPQKREHLRLLLDKVVWDGKKAHIFI